MNNISNWVAESSYLSKDQEDLLYKLNSSNDFTFSFALMELDNYMYEVGGFKGAFEIVKLIEKKREYKQIAFIHLYEFAKEHSARYTTDYEELIEFLIRRLV